MPKRDLVGEFRTLIGSARKNRWLLRSLGISSEERRLRGVCAGKMRFGITLMPVRSAIWIAFGPSKPSMEKPFQRLARNLGFSRHFRTAWYFRPWNSPIEQLDTEASRVLRSCLSGKVDRVDCRPRVAEILRRPRGHVMEQKRGWGLVDWLSTRLEKGWRPELLFLRHETRVRVDGVDWRIDCDGYWEPPDRKGLEVHVALTSRRPMSHRTWHRLQETGFIERVGRQLGQFGLRPDLRPRLGADDFEGTSGGHYLATFECTLSRISEVEAAVRPLLNWSPT